MDRGGMGERFFISEISIYLSQFLYVNDSL